MIKESLKELALTNIKNLADAARVMSYIEPSLKAGYGCTIKEVKDIVRDITGASLPSYEEDEDYYFTSISQLSAALTTVCNPTVEDDAVWHLERKES